ncbi:hypothetical protein BU16DRAFT_566328 [Lophium mytilinum]|uniref:Uncharacterized protein n=1 Tax=Lophium mytilinum TaxID=390894 RepID=A0A6A6QE62_9PEZI|nr:hypothetical protein BU16DRAFT_566328 [Lophium mytilinum]
MSDERPEAGVCRHCDGRLSELTSTGEFLEGIRAANSDKEANELEERLLVNHRTLCECGDRLETEYREKEMEGLATEMANQARHFANLENLENQFDLASATEARRVSAMRQQARDNNRGAEEDEATIQYYQRQVRELRSSLGSLLQSFGSLVQGHQALVELHQSALEDIKSLQELAVPGVISAANYRQGLDPTALPASHPTARSSLLSAMPNITAQATSTPLVRSALHPLSRPPAASPGYPQAAPHIAGLRPKTLAPDKMLSQALGSRTSDADIADRLG